ncbi:MAG: hypothetical protein AB7T49_19390 [Oligoflexales bacterium]
MKCVKRLLVLSTLLFGVAAYGHDQCPDDGDNGGDALLVRYYTMGDCEGAVAFQTHFSGGNIAEYCERVTPGSLRNRIKSIKVYGQCDNIPEVWAGEACLSYAG